VKRRETAAAGQEAGVIRVLDLEIEVDGRWIDSLVLCRLDLKARRLSVYHEGGKGKRVMVTAVDFAVRNVEY
jgi:hypothetical protein